mgnify:FL=1
MQNQYTKFKSSDAVDLWYEKYKSFFPSDNKTDKELLEALDLYTASVNHILNGHLRYNIEIDDFYQQHLAQMVKKIPTYHIPNNIIVYRYISKGLLKEMCPSYPPRTGMLMHDKGFMSTTLIRESLDTHRQADISLKILLEILVPAGTSGTYVGHLKNMPAEYEIILAPNTQLRIDYKFPFYNRYFYCTVVN